MSATLTIGSRVLHVTSARYGTVTRLEAKWSAAPNVTIRFDETGAEYRTYTHYLEPLEAE